MPRTRNYLILKKLRDLLRNGMAPANLWATGDRRPRRKGKSMKKYLLCGVLSLTLAGCGGGSPLTLNQSNLDKIHDGMSTADVRGIMGAPTESKDEPIPLVGGTKTTYVYRNNKSEVTIVFKNDQEQSKQGSFDQ